MVDQDGIPLMPTISFIGSGKVATQLANAFAQKGVPIRQIISLHLENAKTLAEAIEAPWYSDKLEDLDDQADIYIVAVKDDVIPGIISSFPFCLTGNQIILHTSGSFDEKLFRAISKHYGCLYPLQTFQKTGITRLVDTPFLIDAESEESKQIITHVTRLLSENVLEMSPEKRQHLHVAAVFSNNFTVHLLHLAKLYCIRHQIDFHLLWPLIKEGISKAEKNGPEAAQTGPAMRKDHKTIQKHEALLAGQEILLNIYQLLTVSIQKLNQTNEDSQRN